MRAVVAVFLVLLAAPATAAAAPPFLGPDARIFTLAGGGSLPPRDGLPATQADLGEALSGLAALPDGSVAIVTDRGPLMVGQDGRIRLLPRLAGRVNALAAAPDGALFAATRRTIHRLAPGAPGWTRALDLERVPAWEAGTFVSSLIAALIRVRLRPDGARADLSRGDGRGPCSIFGRA